MVLRCEEKNVPIISCMGAGNKLDPTRFEVADIYKISVCPLAKVMRRELSARGVKKLKVVYSRGTGNEAYGNQIQTVEVIAFALLILRENAQIETDTRKCIICSFGCRANYSR